MRRQMEEDMYNSIKKKKPKQNQYQSSTAMIIKLK